MSENVECVVIGAGVVGLAVARELAQAGHETLVLESERHIGTGTSSRNSEVIHAGIYYSPGSLKARLCVAGKQLLYDYCTARGVSHLRCGKLIVATDASQLAVLEKIRALAASNGVHDLALLDAAACRELEPELNCVAALQSPSTGIIDSHHLMLSLQGDLEAAGGMVVFAAPVVGGECSETDIVLAVGGGADLQLRARRVVNCAGLYAQDIAARLVGLKRDSVPPIYYAKGNYYALTRRSPFKRLIYPAPESAGLGVHLTLDMAGRARFGPDVEWVDSINYDVDPQRSASFYDEIRKYWPTLPDGALTPAYSGIRPKLQAPGEPAADFMIGTAREHGVTGLINLFGIESPGLTASLALGRLVCELLE